jgi:hypothetical protein
MLDQLRNRPHRELTRWIETPMFVILLGSVLASGSLPLALATPAPTWTAGTERFAAQTSAQESPVIPQPHRTKVAEGEYAVIEEANSGAVGPFGEEVYDFHELWTMWRAEAGGYEVEGQRRFESPRNTPHDDSFSVRLSRDLTVIDMTEFAKLRWNEDSGPLLCRFLATELRCSSGGSPKNHVERQIPMKRPFGLLWPVSAFSLSGITREADVDPNRGTDVELASIEQPSKENPVEVTILSGKLRYLGAEPLELAGEKWRARKFSLKVPLHPEFLIWGSSQGLLLSVAVEHGHQNWPEEGMKLVRFHKFADF